MSITKQCTHLHQAPSTSTQLILTSTEPNLPPPCSFQPPPSSLQHRQRCWNQHIARNWATSPNLDRKSQSCAFWLKIGRHGILEGPVTNPDLDFVKYKPQNSFFGKFGPKKSKFFALLENFHTDYLKNTNSYSDIIFWIFNTKTVFEQI